jgi:hypothetical protein
MAFRGDEGEVVTLNDAAKWTANYRATIQHGERIGHFFGMNKINDILNQPGCVGIRMYHGLDNGEKVLILVGVTADENDMENGVIVERSQPCPPLCSKKNPLNSK